MFVGTTISFLSLIPCSEIHLHIRMIRNAKLLMNNERWRDERGDS